jgi:plasmid stabilization system protein ParE
MTRVEITRNSTEDLDHLIRTLSLPGDTRERVRKALRPLERFPLLGPELPGRWVGFRFVLGPWRWMILVYVYLEDLDRVIVVSIEDARSARAVTATR